MYNSILTPVQRVMKARLQLQGKAYFIYGILFHAKYRMADDADEAMAEFKTAYADSLGNIVVFPEYIRSKPDVFVELLLYHEAMHLVLKHPVLCEGRNRMVWNIAADVKANQYAKEAGYAIPEGWPHAKYGGRFSWGLCNIRIEVSGCNEKSAIRIYEEIITQLEQQSKMGEARQHGSYGDQGKSKGPGNGQKDDKPEKPGSKGKGGPGESDKPGKPGSDGGQGQEGKPEKPGDPEQGDDVPSHKEWGKQTPRERGEVSKKLDDIIRTAYESAKMRGNMPSGLERAVEMVLGKKKPWRSLLRLAYTRVMPFEPSFEFPHKKSLSCGVYLPHIKKEGVEVIVSIDTSGSITAKELGAFRGQMIMMARQCPQINMTVLVCDAAIHGVFPVRNGYVKDIMNIKIKGGGGTSHLPVYEWCKKNKRNVKLLINFTDGFTQFPRKKDVTINTLWVLTKDSIPKENVPFGRAIKM